MRLQFNLKCSSIAAYYESAGPSLRKTIDVIGNVDGKTVLEIGCGNGDFAVFMALKGATVTGIDTAANGIANSNALAAANGVADRCSFLVADAMEIDKLGFGFDLVVGKCILHHIEPFETFASVLAKTINPGGRGVFLENNAASKMLMFFRRHLTGRFGIPKRSDNEEYPFEPRELNLLKLNSAHVSLHYGEFRFFSIMSEYLFKRKLDKPCFAADNFLFRHFTFLHKYSYRQIIEIIA